ncbi:SRPBCC family protein [Aeromicrobium sp. CF4.19]|uniref:SRPBCC family protein n=1 Tax=Aeromicrobium sp. CF4.19 TaxID=3373082 RepID=UPI003EE6CB29
MPVVESSVPLPVDAATAFAVSQTTGETRLRWDRFIARQELFGEAPAKGVRTWTRHRSRLLTMVSEYVSYNPPTNVGMTMVEGPWFFESFAAGWRFVPHPDDAARSIATWRYSFRCRPAWLAPLAERIGVLVLQRDIDRRIAGFARGCADPAVVAAVGD